MITIDSVTKTYGKKQHEFRALDDVNLEIPSGQSVAIIGKSGSGKSTLMHVMSGLDRVSSGEITVDGQTLSDLTQAQIDRFRAEKIGFIFQSFFVQANETCAENVSLPLEIADVPRSERKTRVLEALEMVDLGEKYAQKAKNLSGGQKQRLAVARAIVSKPKILFADEPTGNLDSQTGEKIEKLLFDLQKSTGATLVLVTHDRDLASQCERQIEIRDGKIVKDSASKGGTS